MKLHVLLTTAVLGSILTFAGSAQAQIIYVDFGPTAHSPGVADSKGNFWTNITAGLTSATALTSTTNASSGITLTLSGFTGGSLNAVTAPTPIATLGPNGGDWAFSDVTNDGLYPNSGNTGTLTLTGLDNAKTYNFTFYGAASRSDVRTTTYSVGANSVSLQTSGPGTLGNSGGSNRYNDSTTVSLIGLAPTAGQLVINFSGLSTPSGNNFGYLNALGIQGIAAVPEPSTYALLGLGLAAICFIRRRNQLRA